MKLCKDLTLLDKIAGHELVGAWGEIDGYTHKYRKDDVRCSLVNQVSRATIRAMRPCFLVTVNRHYKGAPFITEYKKGMVCNFAASTVIKENDPELLRLLEERDSAEYTGTKDDAVRVDAIYDRIEQLGGKHLFWN